MNLFYFIDKIWKWLRTYLIALALIGAFCAGMVTVIKGTRPAIQQPPDGYMVESTDVTLQWDKGSIDQKLKIQLSVDDPDFKGKLIEKKQPGNTYKVENLKRGHTYYWRVVGDKKTSLTSNFKISAHAINFQ